jgi:hypothetical protein
MNRVLFVAGMFYKDLVKPMTICAAVQSIYLGGVLNSIDDRRNGKKKPIYVNLLQMAKYATMGTLVGVTFPISFPTMLMYIATHPNKE